MQNLKEKLHEIIYESESKTGKIFDVCLILLILFSVLIIIIDSIPNIPNFWKKLFYITEWAITILFTIEYILRLYCIGKPSKYAFSFFGIIDLLAILPTYLCALVPGTQYLATIRILRVMRVFRVLKLAKYMSEGNVIWSALIATRRKITVFLFSIFTLVVFLSSTIYVIEGPENGFTSIPISIYWAIVTVTTVGYGDIIPQTILGKMVASIFMILSYAIIAVPTGIVTVEISKVTKKQINNNVCPECSKEGHEWDASFCKFCGAKL